MSLLIAALVTALLITEGWLIARMMLKTSQKWLQLFLALPIASLTNVLIVFVCTIVDIPLTPLSLLLPHAMIIGILTWTLHTTQIKTVAPMQSAFTLPQKSALVLFELLIGATVVSSFAHAVLLPTFQYDSATNWTMRSQISFVDRNIAFDPTEDRGMAKPQYPFLFHALQITANQGQAEWNDTAANAILWALSLSSFAGIAALLSSVIGSFAAIVTVTLILSIPLLSLHLGQGYADIVLTQEMLLALTTLTAWIVRRERVMLLISAIAVSAAVWTKSEGLIVGFVPWLIIVAAATLMDRSRVTDVKHSVITALALSLPWPIFAWSKGLSLTPHSSDTLLGFHMEGVREAFFGLFDRGSFGIAWYVIALGVGWIITRMAMQWRKHDRSLVALELLPLAWGLAVFFIMIVTYLFTPNVRFLLNAESYYRQIMLPCAMLLLSFSVLSARKS
jgi:hypothetical protein